jgi:hypothetical protein
MDDKSYYHYDPSIIHHEHHEHTPLEIQHIEIQKELHIIEQAYLNHMATMHQHIHSQLDHMHTDLQNAIDSGNSLHFEHFVKHYAPLIKEKRQAEYHKAHLEAKRKILHNELHHLNITSSNEIIISQEKSEVESLLHHWIIENYPNNTPITYHGFHLGQLITEDEIHPFSSSHHVIHKNTLIHEGHWAIASVHNNDSITSSRTNAIPTYKIIFILKKSNAKSPYHQKIVSSTTTSTTSTSHINDNDTNNMYWVITSSQEDYNHQPILSVIDRIHIKQCI